MEHSIARGSRQTQTGGLGVVVLAVGIGLIIADFSVVGIGRAIALGGLIFACYQRLDQRISQRTEAADETYRVGYDTGHERGYEEGLAAAAIRPVVVDLAEQRDLRFEAVKTRPFPSAASVGDRD